MEGIDRIKEMAKGQNNPILLAIVQYLISREDMNDNYLKEEKNLKEMATYIEGQVLKEYCEQMDIKNPSSHAKEINYNGTNARCLVVGMSEEKIYELAINYFSKSTEEDKLQRKDNDEFDSIFNTDNDEKINTKKDEIEQISLFQNICA